MVRNDTPLPVSVHEGLTLSRISEWVEEGGYYIELDSHCLAALPLKTAFHKEVPRAKQTVLTNGITLYGV